MKGRPRSLYSSLFLLSWASIGSALLVISMSKGSFFWGSRRRGTAEFISPDAHPYFYWGWLAFWALVCLWIGYLGVKELLGYLRQRRNR